MSERLHITVGIGDPDAKPDQVETVFQTTDPDGRLVIPVEDLLKATSDTSGDWKEQSLYVQASHPRNQTKPDIQFVDNRMLLSPEQHMLVVDDVPIRDLTNREFGLLEFLASDLDMVKERHTIYEEVWQQPFRRGDRVIDVYVRKLRAKIGAISSELGDRERGAIRSHFAVGYYAVSSLNSR